MTIFTSNLPAQLLSDHHWQDRVILLFAPDPQYPELATQLHFLTQFNNEVTERDLVTYQIFQNQRGGKPSGEEIREAETEDFYRHFGADKKTFTFILVGKDGTVKLRSPEAVGMEQLFALIDSMPMRRSEMRRN